MAEGQRHTAARAWPVAKRLVDALAPATSRAVVAGSLRRGRPTVGDIEVVCAALPLGGDLFGTPDPDAYDSEAVRRVLRDTAHGGLAAAGNKYCKATDVYGSGIDADVFIVRPPATWPVILAIRTGPAALVGKCVMSRLNRRGYRCTGGAVYVADTGAPAPVNSECDFFTLAGLPCLPPTRRDDPEARRPAT